MHKKSMEASQKLKEEEEGDDDDDEEEMDSGGDSSSLSVLLRDSADSNPSRSSSRSDKQERRNESIASLRAKAQSYSARVLMVGSGTAKTIPSPPITGHFRSSMPVQTTIDSSIVYQSSFAQPKTDTRTAGGGGGRTTEGGGGMTSTGCISDSDFIDPVE